MLRKSIKGISSPRLRDGVTFLATLGELGSGHILYPYLCEIACRDALPTFRADAACVLAFTKAGGVKLIASAGEFRTGPDEIVFDRSPGTWLADVLTSTHPTVRFDSGKAAAGRPAPDFMPHPTGAALGAFLGNDGSRAGLLLLLRRLDKKFPESDATILRHSAGILHIASSRNALDPARAWNDPKLFAALDALPSLFIIGDKDARYRYLNKAAIDWFGMPACEIIGRGYREMLGDAYADHLEPYVNRALAGEKLHFKTYTSLPSGEFRHTEVDYLPFHNENGVVEGFYVIVTDVTNLKKTAEKLRELNSSLEKKVAERTSELLELSTNVPALFTFVDTKGCYLFASQQYAALFGESPESLIGKSVQEVVGAELYREAGPRYELALQGEEVNTSKVLRRPGMPDRHFRARYSPRRNKEGEIIGAFLLATEITVERELQRAALTAADREREAVARELHDGICQDLTAISFLAKSIEQRLREIGSPETESFAELGTVIRETTQKTRSVAHGLSIAPQGMLGLGESIAMFLKSMSHHTQCRAAIRFLFDETRLTPEAAGHLYLICREAITNSLKHGCPGRLLVRLSSVHDEIRMLVVDNGGNKPDLSAATAGMGLRTIHYRSDLLEGETRLISRRRSPGVLLVTRIPAAGNTTRSP